MAAKEPHQGSLKAAGGEPVGQSVDSTTDLDLDLDESPELREKLGTMNDRHDMDRVGKMQVLRRNFGFLPILGYALVLGCTWEFALIGALFSLPNGGPGGAIWMYFIVAFFYYFVVLSMAEMASMAPICGGQYHWVSEFAPRKYQKPLSFLVGWLVALAWQSFMPAGSFLVAQQIEALIVVADPSYEIKGWHGALFTWAIAIFCIIFNTVLVRRLPLIEGLALVLHVLGFFTFLIVLWVMGPRRKASLVFSDFEDNNGWGSLGLATLVGILSPLNTLGGADAVCHLSEELRDASKSLPRCMVVNATINYILAFIMTITLMFTLGDVEEAFATPTGQPYVQVVLNATQSRGATIVLTAVMAILLCFCAINQVTTSSRQLFAFARDKGLPFSAFLSSVRPGWDIPLNAVVVTLMVTAMLSLIIVGSTTAFLIITSLGGAALLSSYLVAIACLVSKRLRGEPLPPARFSLGRAGIYVNLVAMAFLVVAWVMIFFPSAPAPSPDAMNWASLIFGCVVIFAGIYYLVIGRHHYVGPVEDVKLQ